MHRKTRNRAIIIVGVLLMLLAIWAYVASLDESEPLDQTLPQLEPYKTGGE